MRSVRWRDVAHVPDRRSLPVLAVACVVLAVGFVFCGVISEDCGTLNLPDHNPVRTRRLHPGEPTGTTPAPPAMAEVASTGGPVPDPPEPPVPDPPDPPEPPVPAVTAPGPAPTVGPAVAAAARLGPAVDAPTAALSRLHLDWRPLLRGWRLRFLPGRAGVRGITLPAEKVIEIYVRRGEDPEHLAHVVAHEIGHAIDVTRLGDDGHRAWMVARGIPTDVAWYPSGSAVPDFATPAGDWAESFASWQVGRGWYSRLGPPPDAAQTALVARLVGGG